ncbi:phosphate transport system permease protein [Marmoricola sp. OAE513]|uniref:phosphate ABC transporter permease PstA n=1 Tax=Marmoricola sp. OAE513 TaxID=2817894 RepID=UPI001AE1F8D0
MSTAVLAPATPLGLARPRLPRWAPLLTAGLAIALGALVMLTLDWGVAGWIAVAAIAFLVALPSWSYAVEGRRAAVDRNMTNLVWTAFIIALVPLLSLIWTVISKGAPQINGTFLGTSMFRTSLSQPIGIYHALIGTLLITLFAALLAVPIGIFSAIYLVEYGNKGRLARVITFLVDVMTGIPSIVAGLFAFALFSLIFGPSVRMGFGGSVALALLMIPIVVRATEEMLRLVPSDLREASYALGVPKWRTIAKVVLPTALGGIVSGVTLAIARVVGETAPLLIIAGLTTQTNWNVFSDRMTTLPVLIFTQNANPGVPKPGHDMLPGVEVAWGGAFVLIVIVMLLNLVARIVGKIFAPKTGH